MAQLKSIQRAFELIDLLWQMDGGTPSEFANRLEIPVSTAHDYLQSLEATDYVVKEGGRYQLSYGFLSMGSRLQRRNKLFHVARPEVGTLAEETGEIANVSVEEDDQWTLLHGESGYQGLKLGIYPGLKTPLHTHAAGKVILAHLPAGRRSALIDRGLEQMTSYTITDGTALKSELSKCRKEDMRSIPMSRSSGWESLHLHFSTARRYWVQWRSSVRASDLRTRTIEKNWCRKPEKRLMQ